MKHLVLFDFDDSPLSPLCDLRPSFELRSGIVTTRQRIEYVIGCPASGLWVAPRLADLTRAVSGLPVNEPPGSDGAVQLVSGRWLLPRNDHIPPPGAACMTPGGRIIAATLDAADAKVFLDSGALPDHVRVETVENAATLERPCDVIRHAPAAIEYDLSHVRILEAAVPDTSVVVRGEHPIEIHRSARVAPGVVFDAGGGPVIVDEGAVVRPGAVVCGPCYVGRGSVVVDRAHIKSGTVIGPVCKVGGEVGATIFQGFSNKGHDGHLGDSWVGEWVNFGAGTTNSNLLNTYGEVSMSPAFDRPAEPTGMTFLGAVIGDHVKFAILTRIMTGSLIGTGAMIATTAPPPTTVRPFAWMTDAGVRTYRLDRLVDTARAMMSRRGVEPSVECLEMLRSLHAAHTGG